MVDAGPEPTYEEKLRVPPPPGSIQPKIEWVDGLVFYVIFNIISVYWA